MSSPKDSARKTGVEAEILSTIWLEKQGYGIIEKNYRSKFGEIDIIAKTGDILCFIEVKARSENSISPAIYAVDSQKIKKIIKTAHIWLAKNKMPFESVRFDVLALSKGVNDWKIEHIVDAFNTD